MIGVAILGAGIGREHLAGYRALSDRFTVRRLVDLDPARAAEVAAGDPAIRLGTDLADALNDPDIHLVDVCLPPHLHVPVAVQALEAGKHVVLEKPIAPSLADCDRLAEAETRSGRRLFPVFQYRYGRGTAALDALIAAGLAGRPQVAALETHWNRGAAYYAVPWRGTWAGERGGAVLGHAIHNHDLLCRYFGQPAGVAAQVATRVNPIETEDCAAIALRFDTGALATSSVTLGAATDTTRLRLVFEHLTATSGDTPYAPAEGDWRFVARDPARQPQVDATLAALPRPRAGFAGYFEAIAEALAGRPGREVTLADGRRSIELVTAVYEAARGGKEVALPLTIGSEFYASWLPRETATSGPGRG
ncbi:Gfo/Idh/MocA family protein [Roseicyclus persicicus]|uniref:Gfo/Idh/MocA family oxidoreductase n=1 Tax=Roseicyclus persicicus TaxID=2650661 RepID=A0A7X6H2P5_9RHOB|nr:Gfo/Idh/MocA family oxidoreductase [Roseibacterium persicicum]NKX45731.1 Gfo/Idh/MocA family oxidoreductase [Roseibacterium persicicum]